MSTKPHTHRPRGPARSRLGAAAALASLLLPACWIQSNPGHVDFRPHATLHDALVPTPNPHVPDRIQELGKRADFAGSNVDIVFLGDSLIQFWEKEGARVWDSFYGERALNLGCTWDQTQHLLWRIQLGHLDRLSPRVVVLQIGTNNTRFGRHGPQEIADGVASILEEIRRRHPRAVVLLTGILPRGRSTDDPWRANNRVANQLLRGLADGQRVRFLDLSESFVEPDGTISSEIMYDALHLTELGYERWAKAMAPSLADALGT